MYDCGKDASYDRELDRIYEAAVAQDWEEQNACSDDFHGAEEQLSQAETEMAVAIQCLAEASERIEGTPDAIRIDSLRDLLETLYADVSKMKTKVGGFK